MQDEDQFLTKYAIEIRGKCYNDAQRLRVTKDHGTLNSYRVFRGRGNKRSATGKDAELGISHDEQTVYINFEKEICNCTCYDVSDNKMICKHIVAVMIHLRKKKMLEDPTKAHMFYHRCYWMDNLKEAYKENIETVWGSALVKTDTLGPIVGHTSNLGKRIRSAHNRHQAKRSGRLPKRCSICRLSNHTRRKCPMKDLSEEDRKRALADVFQKKGVDAIIEERNSFCCDDDEGGEAEIISSRSKEIKFIDIPFAELIDEEDNQDADYAQIKQRRSYLEKHHFVTDSGCEKGEQHDATKFSSDDDDDDFVDDAIEGNTGGDDDGTAESDDTEEEDSSTAGSVISKGKVNSYSSSSDDEVVHDKKSKSTWYETILNSFNAFNLSRIGSDEKNNIIMMSPSGESLRTRHISRSKKQKHGEEEKFIEDDGIEDSDDNNSSVNDDNNI